MKKTSTVALLILSGCTTPQGVDLTTRPTFDDIRPRLTSLRIGMTPSEVAKALGLERYLTPPAGSAFWTMLDYDLQDGSTLVLDFMAITREDGKHGLSGVYFRESQKKAIERDEPTVPWKVAPSASSDVR